MYYQTILIDLSIKLKEAKPHTQHTIKAIRIASKEFDENTPISSDDVNSLLASASDIYFLKGFVDKTHLRIRIFPRVFCNILLLDSNIFDDWDLVESQSILPHKLPKYELTEADFWDGEGYEAPV
jgi:hypothetical protein